MERKDTAYRKMMEAFTPAQRRRWNEIREEMRGLSDVWRDQEMGPEKSQFANADRLATLVCMLPIFEEDGSGLFHRGSAEDDF